MNLTERLQVRLPFADLIRVDVQNEQTQKALQSLLELIKEAFVFMQRHAEALIHGKSLAIAMVVC